MLIAQLTDMHVGGADVATYYRLDTLACLERAVDALNAVEPRPDLCLVTGDIVENGRADEYALARRALDRLTMPWHPIPGNHDDRDAFLTAFSDRLSAEQLDGFAQYRISAGNLDVLLLDTVVPRNTHGHLCARRLGWVEAALATSSRPTVLALHHPPFPTGQPNMDTLGLGERDDFAALVARHRHIEAVVCGHVHRAIHGRVAHASAFCAPSSAHQIALGLHGRNELLFTHEPSGVALHHWNGPGTWTTLVVNVGSDDARYPFT